MRGRYLGSTDSSSRDTDIPDLFLASYLKDDRLLENWNSNFFFFGTGVFDTKNTFFGPTVHRHHEDS